MRDDRVALTPKTFKVAGVESVKALRFVVAGGDKVQVIEDGTAANAARLGLIEGLEQAVFRQMQEGGAGTDAAAQRFGGIGGDGRGLILPLVRVLKVSTSACVHIANGPDVTSPRHSA